jgi:hypothetical protein
VAVAGQAEPGSFTDLHAAAGASGVIQMGIYEGLYLVTTSAGGYASVQTTVHARAPSANLTVSLRIGASGSVASSGFPVLSLEIAGLLGAAILAAAASVLLRRRRRSGASTEPPTGSEEELPEEWPVEVTPILPDAGAPDGSDRFESSDLP